MIKVELHGFLTSDPKLELAGDNSLLHLEMKALSKDKEVESEIIIAIKGNESVLSDISGELAYDIVLTVAGEPETLGVGDYEKPVFAFDVDYVLVATYDK